MVGEDTGPRGGGLSVMGDIPTTEAENRRDDKELEKISKVQLNYFKNS